jgi:two-component system, NtrC family, sensor kinase
MQAPQPPLQWKFIIITSAGDPFVHDHFRFSCRSRNRAALHEATEKQGKVLAQTVAALIINELIYEKLGLVEEGGLIDSYLQELFKRGSSTISTWPCSTKTAEVISHSDFREYGKVYRDKVFVFPKGAR